MEEQMNTDNTFKGSSDYVASDELMRAANIAIALEKPLLIKGEPGTGKTMLAQAVSKALNKRLIIWNIKSTTKAQDGLYVYDVVQRLYDSQFGGEGVDDIKKYVKLGKLGEAFSSDEQVILLIDEIDKADIEFPNDLLWELDKMEFYIPETKETIKAKKRPIVIITSNAEKELPDAFLRRCIFHYIQFPDKELMEEIVKVHFNNIDQKLLDQVMETFYWIRDLDINKKPSTSEVIDWIQALEIGGIPAEKIKDEIPFAGVLLKKNEDLEVVERSRRRFKY
jgi:MoxR-like ATPase